MRAEKTAVCAEASVTPPLLSWSHSLSFAGARLCNTCRPLITTDPPLDSLEHGTADLKRLLLGGLGQGRCP